MTQIWAQLKLRPEECMSSLAPTEYDKGLQDDDDDDHNESEIEVENQFLLCVHHCKTVAFLYDCFETWVN